MSKTRDTGFLANVIQVHDTGVRIMSGSEMLMAISSSGAVTITGELSGSDAANSLLLDGTGSLAFTTTASFLVVSASQQQISSSLLQVSASYTALSGSYNTFSGSASTRTTQIENVYATTGSNSFRADQSITGSLVVSSTITAQTLVVQTVTSSIVYSSGSNLFGSALGDRQTFTGSLNVTGSSHSIFGNIGIGTNIPRGVFDVRVASDRGIVVTGTVSSETVISGMQGDVSANLRNLRIAGNTLLFNTGDGTNTSGSQVMAITSTGNVCIGSTASTTYGTLNIVQQSVCSPSFVRGIELVHPNGTGGTGGYIGISMTGQKQGTIQVGDDGACGNLILQSQGGNVGIGTCSPGQILSLSSDNATGTALNIINTSSGGYNWNIFSVGSGACLAPVGSLAFRDSTNGATRMVISTSGNVGIGAVSPDATLHICCSAGSANALLAHFQNSGGGTAIATIKIGEGSPEGQYGVLGHYGVDNSFRIGSVNGNLSFHAGASTACGTNLYGMCERLTILTSGCVGIGTATPGYRLEICGDGTGIGELAVKGTGTDIGLALNNTGTGGKAWRILSTGGGSGAGNGKLITWDGTGYGWVMDCGRNMGIGTTTVDSYPNYTVLQVGCTNGIIQTYDGCVKTAMVSNSQGAGLMGTRTNHDLRIVSNDTERIRIMSTGITCFACQICAASGVKFASGASTLNYYEAGTWTPQLYWSSGGYYTMVGINGGSYVRVGNLVHLNFQLQWGARCSGGSFAGNLNVAGIPFTAGTYRSAGPISAISSGVAASSCAYTWFAYTIDPGATFLYLIQQGQYGGYNHAPTTSDSGVIYSSTITYTV